MPEVLFQILTEDYDFQKENDSHFCNLFKINAAIFYEKKGIVISRITTYVVDAEMSGQTFLDTNCQVSGE